MVRPLAGLTMGMALRVRVAAGWCNLSVDCWAWWVGGTKAGDEELREKEATCCGCWVGEELGELLDSEDRSEDALLIDTSYRASQLGLSMGGACTGGEQAGRGSDSRPSQSTAWGRTPYRPRGRTTCWPRIGSGSWIRRASRSARACS
jgi:hypothetical protein